MLITYSYLREWIGILRILSFGYCTHVPLILSVVEYLSITYLILLISCWLFVDLYLELWFNYLVVILYVDWLRSTDWSNPIPSPTPTTYLLIPNVRWIVVVWLIIVSNYQYIPLGNYSIGPSSPSPVASTTPWP